MIYLNVVVEGQTEETFVRDVLAPYWGASGIFAVARCVETSRRRGRIFRGGGKNYEKTRQDIVNWLNQHQEAYCTTMFDLYGLPQNFPRRSSMDVNLHPYEKVGYFENAFSRDIGNDRFIPYIQLHEFEALLFAEIDKMRVFYLDGKRKAIERLVKVANSFDSPELINEGNETAPSKRIANEIPEYSGDKVLVGPSVAKAIGLEILRERCDHFNEWMSRIEGLNTV